VRLAVLHPAACACPSRPSAQCVCGVLERRLASVVDSCGSGVGVRGRLLVGRGPACAVGAGGGVVDGVSSCRRLWLGALIAEGVCTFVHHDTMPSLWI